MRQQLAVTLRLFVALALFVLALTLWPIATHAQVSLDDLESRIVTEERAQRTGERRKFAEARLAAEAKRRAQLPGIVHKNERFWLDKQGMSTGRALFEGRFADVDDEALSLFLVEFVLRYSADCGKDVGRGIYRKFKLTQGDSEWYAYIESEFADRFVELWTERYAERKAEQDFLEELINRPESLATSGLSVVRNRFERMRSIRAFNSSGCNSATSAQLRWNLFRRMHNLPSVQARGSIPGAAAESDPLPDLASFLSVKDSCVDHHVGKREDWCGCVDEHARKQFVYDDYLYYADRFEAFIADSREPSHGARAVIRACRS